MSKPNMISGLIPKEEHKDFSDFIYLLRTGDKRYLLRNDIWLKWLDWCRENDKDEKFTKNSSIARFLSRVPEMLFPDGIALILHRYTMGRYRIYRLSPDHQYLEEISVNRYLDYKDAHVLGNGAGANRDALELDFMPFYDYAPTIKNVRNLGNGISYLNKYMSSSLFHNPEQWGSKLFEFLRIHKINGEQLLVNPDILKGVDDFLPALEQTIDELEHQDPDTGYQQLKSDLKTRGFEPGWGHKAGRIRETMGMLHALFHEPRSADLEEFISRVPMISKVAILSPHGWFAQENVLGKPDTGGQVIYILDQVRALEDHLKKEFELSGIDVTPRVIVLTRLIPNAGNTTCNQPGEDIVGTEHARILRIPFFDSRGHKLEDWVSRFKIWPYLSRFASDCERELLAEFQGRPDLIIGNYSDGNLVATLLSDRLDVVQCTIAHALEKTKYLFSDLYWQNMEPDYHFSCQFTADLLSMNKSDFIITSTYQEIAGTETRFGQYESYQFYTMPGLCQVVNGVNLFNPKFNVVPPGVDETNYFPYYENDRRSEARRSHWEKRLFSLEHPDIYGRLENPEKPPIFTMARLDRIKNITGLVEAFGMHPELKHNCNLIVAAGTIHPEESEDPEEQNEIRRMYELIETYELQGSIRWLPSVPKEETGEVYRIIADNRGMFIQPALFEAFGLTILEAMQCGLPTFGPIFGGPSEIIRDAESGYLMNTSQPDLIAETIWRFVSEYQKDAGKWGRISKGGMARVKEAFTWERYSEKLFSLTKLYGFWRYTESQAGMVKLDRYCDLLYHLLLKPRSQEIES
ncbi:MAG: sucrose synthase [Desulfobacteraceae bacterium]|nr:sucrose synthase [Desulfobacteraceae bacterium]MCF8093780.1 sucrose synthase [Desulfobacteraceae bacterium]